MKDVLRLMASPIALAWLIYRIARRILWSTIQATALSVGCVFWWGCICNLLWLLVGLCKISASVFPTLNTTESAFQVWARRRELKRDKLICYNHGWGFVGSFLLGTAIITTPIQTGHYHWLAVTVGAIIVVGCFICWGLAGGKHDDRREESP